MLSTTPPDARIRLLANQFGLGMHVDALDWVVGRAAHVGAVVRIGQAVIADVAVDLDFPRNVIPNMRAADTATIQLQRQLAVYFAPRFTDTGPQVALQGIDEIGEFFRVVPVLPMTSDRQARRLVVFPVGIVATNTLPPSSSCSCCRAPVVGVRSRP